MSTVLIAFWAKSDDDLQQQIGAMKLLMDTNPGQKTYGSREGIEIQVFRTSKGIVYRVLESGYGLRNLMWEQENVFPSCFFDGRSQSEADFPLEVAIAEEIDHLITTKQYFVEHIVEKT